jgi:isocitrate lyase
MGYRFQFITLAGWHMVNLNAFELASAYAAEGMPAYVRLQAREFELESEGYTATRHQREAGTAYFDQLLLTITGGTSSTAALQGSTEAEQFIAREKGIADIAPSPRPSPEIAKVVRTDTSLPAA